MAFYILHKGRLMKDPGIDRGPMLLHSEDEWRQRRNAFLTRSMKKSVVFVAIFLWPVPWFMSLILSEWLGHLGLVLIVVTGLYIALVIGVSYIIHREMRIKNMLGPADGLYENGVQELSIFVPYVEIASIERKSVLMGEKAVIFHTRYPMRDEKGKLIKRPWSFSASFLGEDGIEVLKRKIHAQSSPK